MMMPERNAPGLIRSMMIILAIVMLGTVLPGALTARNENPADRMPVNGPVINGREAYHVIVAGGEPEGVAAALAAGRNGMKTLLVEEGEALGGLITLGWLNFLDMNYGPYREIVTRGIFEEFHRAVGPGVVIDIEEAKKWFFAKCDEEPNLTVMLNTEVVAPVMDGNKIIGLEIREKGQAETTVVRSMAVIDATVDGDVAAAAGAPYTVGAEDRGEYGTKQGVTLVFEVSGVDWDRVSNHLRHDGRPDTGADATSAWGYSAEALSYISADGNMRFRGPNIALMRNGNVLLNALIIFGVDALDPVSLYEGIARGQREIPYIIEFMRENFTGFENTAFVSHAPRLYVRETRHFIGEYRLTITDVLENRDHWDRIGHGSYPVDLQPTRPGDFGNIIGNPAIYSIPFRCLVPLKIEQLLIVGRSASFDSLPHGSARVIPIGMVTAEAAGTAVAYSVEHGVTFRQMAYDTAAVAWLQSRLLRQGAYLIEYDPPYVAVMDHWAYPGVAVMREFAMAAGGYGNNYDLEGTPRSHLFFQNSINWIMRLVSEKTEREGRHRIPAWSITLSDAEVTVSLLLLSAAECVSLGDRTRISQDIGEPRESMEMTFISGDCAMDYLIGQGVIAESNRCRFSDMGATATYGQIMYILGNTYTALMNEG